MSQKRNKEKERTTQAILRLLIVASFVCFFLLVWSCVGPRSLVLPADSGLPHPTHLQSKDSTNQSPPLLILLSTRFLAPVTPSPLKTPHSRQSNNRPNGHRLLLVPRALLWLQAFKLNQTFGSKWCVGAAVSGSRGGSLTPRTALPALCACNVGNRQTHK